MGKPQTQDEIAAERRARVAAHRRLAAFRFGLEEHEANAVLPFRGPHEIARADGAVFVVAEFAAG